MEPADIPEGAGVKGGADVVEVIIPTITASKRTML